MISVIIPSYNSEGTISKCLSSILHQTYCGPYEIILIDSSADRTPEIVRGQYPEIQYIHLKQKTDPGTARNIGIWRARGDLIAFIDSDCVAEHDWLERIKIAHQAGYSVVGGVVINGNDADDRVAMAGYLAEFREFLPNQSKREVGHIPTCNISYKRWVFGRYGFFPGRYYPQEDLVFNHRLRIKGERILLDPAIRVRHHHRSCLVDFLRHQHKIGVITAKVLRLIDLEGAMIVRQPYWGVLVLPCLPVVKFVRTVAVFKRYCPEAIRAEPSVLFLFGLGLFFWGLGFCRGIYARISL